MLRFRFTIRKTTASLRVRRSRAWSSLLAIADSSDRTETEVGVRASIQGTGVIDELVVARTAFQIVIVVAAPKIVVAVATKQLVVSCTAPQRVVAAVRGIW